MNESGWDLDDYGLVFLELTPDHHAGSWCVSVFTAQSLDSPMLGEREVGSARAHRRSIFSSGLNSAHDIDL